MKGIQAASSEAGGVLPLGITKYYNLKIYYLILQSFQLFHLGPNWANQRELL